MPEPVTPRTPPAPTLTGDLRGDLEATLNSPAPTGKGDTGNPDSPTIPVERQTPRIPFASGPEASDYEIRTVGKLMTLFNEARQQKRPLIGRWKRNYRMLRNQFWDTSARPNWMPSPQLPEIFPIIDALVAWESDQQPSYTIAPKALPHTDFQRFFQNMGDNLTTVLESSMVNNAEDIQWAIGNWDKYMYGTGIMKTTWDMTLAGGIGDAITRRVDPFSFYPDPNATSTDTMDYCVEAKRMSVQELDRRWPGAGALFENGGSADDIDEAPNQIHDNGSTTPRGNTGAIAPATTPRYNRPGGGKNLTDAVMPAVTVFEFWLRDHESYSAVDRATTEGPRKTTRSFDKWRVVIVANNRIIMDEPADNLWSHGGHPYDRLVVRDTGEFWGFSLVEFLVPAQTSYNRLLAAMQQNIELTGNPVYKEPKTSRSPQFTNRPGQKITVGNSGAGEAGWLQPPRLDSSMPNLMQHFLQRMEAISGLTAVMKGGSPGGRNAQGVIDAMQEAGFVRIRSSLRFFEAAMRSAGTKKADMICENYTQRRLIAIAGPGGEKTSLALKQNHFLIPTRQGSTPLKFQLMVDIGSRRATSRSMREDRAVQLFTLGAIGRQDLLEDIDYPNATSVAEEMDKKEAAMAAAGQNGVGPSATRTATRA